MIDKYIAWTNIKGKKFPLCLTVGSSEDLEKAFGSIDAIGKSVTEHAEKGELSEMMRTILTALRPLAEAGKCYLAASAAFSGEKVEEIDDLPPNETLNIILSGTEIIDIWADVALALRGGSSRDVEVAPDNSSKNGETAM
nr:MAG TPA: hypothetical protein [Caudoviricetes sp.]